MRMNIRKPEISNKYNLDITKIRHLVVKDRSKICEPLFWRNDVISAWCISEEVGNKQDIQFSTSDSYWMGIYDEDAKSYKGKIRVRFDSYGGMCGYKFEKFYNPSDIDGEVDLLVQERFLEKINYLIDNGILGMEEK